MKKFFQIAGFPIRLPLFFVMAAIVGLCNCVVPGFFDHSDWLNVLKFLRGA